MVHKDPALIKAKHAIEILSDPLCSRWTGNGVHSNRWCPYTAEEIGDLHVHMHSIKVNHRPDESSKAWLVLATLALLKHLWVKSLAWLTKRSPGIYMKSVRALTFQEKERMIPSSA